MSDLSPLSGQSGLYVLGSSISPFEPEADISTYAIPIVGW
jgi:hypothetical protein